MKDFISFDFNNPLEVFHSVLFEDGIEIILAQRKTEPTVDIVDENTFFSTTLRNVSNKLIRLISDKASGEVEDFENYILAILEKLEVFGNKIANSKESNYSPIIKSEYERVLDFAKTSYPEYLELKELVKNTQRFFKLGDALFPFKFYEDLIFHNGIKNIHDSFYIQTIYTRDYKFIQELNSEFIYEAWLKKDDSSDQIHIEHYVVRVLKFNNKRAFETLSKSIIKMEETEVKKFLILQLNLLNSLVEKYDADMSNVYPEIRDDLIGIISDINIKYAHYQLTHKAFRKLTKNSDRIFSFFQVKSEITTSFFEKLYDFATSLYLIDGDEISEEMFFDAFTSANPEPTSKVIFTKPNFIVASFLKEIEPFFENFNSVSIEKSKLFLNKQGKPLKSNDLYTALSRNKDPKNTNIVDIQNEVNLLKKQYLK